MLLLYTRQRGYNFYLLSWAKVFFVGNSMHTAGQTEWLDLLRQLNSWRDFPFWKLSAHGQYIRNNSVLVVEDFIDFFAMLLLWLLRSSLRRVIRRLLPHIYLFKKWLYLYDTVLLTLSTAKFLGAINNHRTRKCFVLSSCLHKFFYANKTEKVELTKLPRAFTIV